MFDGVISQNPEFNLPQAGVAEAWNEQALAPLATSMDANGQPYIPDTFPSQDLQVASAAILGACDALDGLVDEIIDDYHACTNKKVFPALNAFTCGTGVHGATPHGGTCLTSGQVWRAEEDLQRPGEFEGQAALFELVLGWRHLGPADRGKTWWAGMNVALAPVPGVNTAANLTLGAGAVPMIFVTPPAVTPVAGPAGQEAYIFHFDFDKDAPKISPRPGTIRRARWTS